MTLGNYYLDPPALRSLRDLRRYGQQITINDPGQVNIGQQQVNATQVQQSSSRDPPIGYRQSRATGVW